MFQGCNRVTLACSCGMRTHMKCEYYRYRAACEWLTKGMHSCEWLKGLRVKDWKKGCMWMTEGEGFPMSEWLKVVWVNNKLLTEGRILYEWMTKGLTEGRAACEFQWLMATTLTPWAGIWIREAHVNWRVVDIICVPYHEMWLLPSNVHWVNSSIHEEDII